MRGREGEDGDVLILYTNNSEIDLSVKRLNSSLWSCGTRTWRYPRS